MAFDPEKDYSSINPNKKHRLFILPLLALRMFVLSPSSPGRSRRLKKGRVGACERRVAEAGTPRVDPRERGVRYT